MSDDQRPPIPAYDPDAQRPRPAVDENARAKALERIEARKEFRGHLTSYVLVMALLVVIWLVTSGFGTYFWPIWPMLGWGIGLGFHGFSLRWDNEPTEEDIEREVARMRLREQGRIED